MNWYIGTMGFSYPDWKGEFYPSEMPPRNFLTYYSRVFSSVEIDSTFYGTPKIDTVKRWKAVTPENFKICVKVPRMITHEMRLINVGGLLNEFLDRMQMLEEKLGVVLFQFPPSFKIQEMQRLGEFITELPSRFRYAIEVRDRSWYTAGQEFRTKLETRGICWVATEYPRLPGRINPTAEFLYIRWIGQHGSFTFHNRERIDRTENMKSWLKQISTHNDQMEDLFGFYNNDYAGFAAGSANRFKEMIGLPIKKLKPPQQGALF